MAKDYGEPWQQRGKDIVSLPRFVRWFIVADAKEEVLAARIVAAINTLAGVPDSELSRVREVLKREGMIGKDGGK